MGKYVLRRLIQMMLVVFGITILVFFMLRLIPGDPCRKIHGRFVRPEIILKCQAEHGFDKPVWEQYLSYVGRVFKGDMGRSLFYRRPAMEVFLERLPATLFLVLYSGVLSVIIAVPLGSLAALKKDSVIDQLIRGATTIGLSMPAFWIGLLLMLFLSVRLALFPVSGYGKTLFERLHHLFLPSLTIAATMATLLARNLRSQILEVIQAEYVRTATAKGLPPQHVFMRHVLRNSTISFVTLLGLNLAWLVGGTVVVEEVFTIPGIGSLLVSSIFNRDYDLVQNITLVYALIVVLMNLLTDLAYPLLDPRVRYE